MSSPQYEIDAMDVYRDDIIADHIMDKSPTHTSFDMTSNSTLDPQLSGSYLHGFIASLSMIVVSEIGDKTFFIAAIMAMKNSRISVFVAAMLALAVMTILASVIGVTTTIIPKIYIHYTSVVLFLVFGIKMLKQGIEMSSEEANEELKNVETDIEHQEHTDHRGTSNGTFSKADIEKGGIGSAIHTPEVSFKTKIRRKFMTFVSLAFIKTFTMIFVAEWGDRSQISTMVLAARENAIAVTVGSLLGHAICTGGAVIGGRFIAQRISVRTVTIVGGFTFIIFALVAIIIGE